MGSCCRTLVWTTSPPPHHTNAICCRELDTSIMARRLLILLASSTFVLGTPTAREARRGKQLVTCPGFPGYCSESYVGDTCTVVCARGRNNVPQCQEDGTWTDVPRCIEHEPGVEEQVTGVCPGVPGYCSLDLPGALCEFACPIGAPIRSECTEDGTWEPYPTCDGDPRETQDGCDPCPGPNGAMRNRTLEAGSGPRNSAGSRGGQRPNNGGQRSNNGGGGSRRNQNNNRPKQAAVHSEFQEPRSFPTPSNKNNRPKNNQNQISNTRDDTSGQCPGDQLAACIDVCPGFSARIFGACVAGCAKRCPARK